MIDEQRLKEFQQLYKKHFGVELPRKEAITKAKKVLAFFEIMYQPARKKE